MRRLAVVTGLLLLTQPANAQPVAQKTDPVSAGQVGIAPGGTQRTTWEPPAAMAGGILSSVQLHHLPDTAFAFPRARKEPLTDAEHVRSALARFRQVANVTEEERDLAFANIRKAAQHFGVKVAAKDWRELGRKRISTSAR